MEKIIFEIERQIQRLQAAKKFLIETHDSSMSLESLSEQMGSASAAPLKRGRGRPRKYPLVLSEGTKAEPTTA